MPFFGQFGTLHSVALEREGNWITVSSNGHVVSGVSSEWLTSAISFARHDILCSAPWSYKRESLSTTESMGMKDVVEHCAFLKYLGYGMEALDKTLTEREERLRIMRGNLSFLVSFVGGIDPMEYGAQEQVLAGYSLFYEHPRGHCRSLGTYFVRHPVEKAMQKRNNERHDSDHKYVVFSESSRFGKLEQLLTRVCSTLEEISEKGQFGRDPISPEEVDVIKKFTEKIGVPSS
jgi:hypothetical protein